MFKKTRFNQPIINIQFGIMQFLTVFFFSYNKLIRIYKLEYLSKDNYLMYDRGPMLNLSFSLLDINPDEMEKSRNQELQGRKEKKDDILKGLLWKL